MIGSIGYDLTRKQPYIDSVWMMAKDTLSMQNDLNNHSSWMATLGILAGFASTWLGYYLYTTVKAEYGRTSLLKKQAILKAKLVENSLKQHSELTEDQKEQLMCIICNEFLRDVIVLPCHHLSACTDCYKHLQNKSKCMECGKPVTGTANVYLE